jgi:hypothetical protein
LASVLKYIFDLSRQILYRGVITTCGGPFLLVNYYLESVIG